MYLSNNFPEKMHSFFDRKRRMAFGIFAAVSVVVLSSCQTAYNATASKALVHYDLCAEAWLAYPNQPHPMWEEIKAGDMHLPSGFMAPQKYKAYHVNSDTLTRFFTLAKDNNYTIILPLGDGCEPFLMRASGAMSPGLQAKYPKLVSLQGNGVSNKPADLRLDWDGLAVRGQVMYNGSVFFLAPAGSKEDLVYLIYNKDDAGDVKQPFETPAGTRQAPKMEHLQQTYDR